jgi:hypothetical protein
MVAVLLYSQVLCLLSGGEGVRIYLSGEARTARWLRASLGCGERLELYIGGCEILAVIAYESAPSSATTRSNSPVRTHLSFSRREQAR